MHVTHTCNACGQSTSSTVSGVSPRIVCAHCGESIEAPAGAVVDGRVVRCLVCPGADMYVRKDFPQRLGVAIVVLGFAASCVTWYFYWTLATFGVLFLTALADVVLYLIVDNALMCYRCGAVYRDVRGLQEHGGFDLETHERYRQEAARLERTPVAGPRARAEG